MGDMTSTDYSVTPQHRPHDGPRAACISGPHDGPYRASTTRVKWRACAACTIRAMYCQHYSGDMACHTWPALNGPHDGPCTAYITRATWREMHGLHYTGHMTGNERGLYHTGHMTGFTPWTTDHMTCCKPNTARATWRVIHPALYWPHDGPWTGPVPHGPQDGPYTLHNSTDHITGCKSSTARATWRVIHPARHGPHDGL